MKELDEEEVDILASDRDSPDEMQSLRRGDGASWRQFYVGEYEAENTENTIASFFSNPKWRIIPLLIFPYSACFSTSLTMTFARSLSGMAIAESSNSATSPISAFDGLMPKFYVL